MQYYTNCIVFGQTRPGLEPTIYMYHTRSKHANCYTTDAVVSVVNNHWNIYLIVVLKIFELRKIDSDS